MINLVEFPYGKVVPNIDLKTFINKLDKNIKKEVLEFILKNEEVEVTHISEINTYKFDFVDIKPILEDGIGEEKYKDLLSIDINLYEGTMKIYVVLNSIEYLLHNAPESKKNDILSDYIVLKSKLKKINFGLEYDDMTGVSLVSNNLKSITMKKMSKALNLVEEYRYNVIEDCLDF